MRTQFLLLSLLCLFTFSVSAQWKTLETEGSCTKRHENGFVAHLGDLYLMGGRGIKPVEKYSPQSNTWTALSATPIEIHHFTPVSVNGKIYIVGGLTGKYPVELPLTHVYVYDPKEDTWTKEYEIPKERRRGGAGVTVYQNKIYIVNGITFGHTSGTNAMFDVYDPAEKTWTMLTDAPNIRDHSAAVIWKNKLIALGGRNTSYHEPDQFNAFFSTVKSEVDYYDFETKKWNSYADPLPNPSAGPGVTVLNDLIYYMGGETGEKLANNQVYAFDPTKEQWIKKPYLVTGRHGTNAVIHEGKIYIAAGCANRGGSPELNSIEVYEEEMEEGLHFAANGDGSYSFNTGVLRGIVRREGRSIGLIPVMFNGTNIAAGEGLFNHYRVFTQGVRYGYGARRWPSTAELLEDGSLEVTWPETSERPFELTAKYTWVSPNTLDVETTVDAKDELEAFEVFLSSYYSKEFNESSVYAKSRGSKKPGFVLAKEAEGVWQVFPRDKASTNIIFDGRWDLGSSPLKWEQRSDYEKPIAVRRNPENGNTIVSMSKSEDCFGIFTPYGNEKHFSNYLSLFGYDIEKGKRVTTKARLVVLADPTNQEILEVADKYLK